MIDYQAIGAYISELRKESGMTQTELAERLNVTHQAVSKWENGMTLPDTEILFSLSKLFKISIDDILNVNRKEEALSYSDKDKDRYNSDNGSIKQTNNTFDKDDYSEEDESKLGHLCGLAPFLNREVLDKEIEKIEKIDLGNLIGIAPFLSREAIGKAVDKIVDENIDLGLVIGLAPFVNRDTLDVLFEKVTEYDIGNLVGIAPFLHSSTLERAVKKVGIDGIEKGLLQGLAPFISRECLNELYLNAK